ncbi:hypothetical protein V8C35DRAFT_296586 [Trichoderma chlorosporum]
MNEGFRADFPIEVARYRDCFFFILFEVLLVVGYGWAAHFRVHPAVLIVLQFFICGTLTLLIHTACALLVVIFPDMSSTAYASGQIMRCGCFGLCHTAAHRCRWAWVVLHDACSLGRLVPLQYSSVV